MSTVNPRSELAEKYARREAKRAGMSVDKLLEFHEVVPCDCGRSSCKGWALRRRFLREREKAPL